MLNRMKNSARLKMAAKLLKKPAGRLEPIDLSLHNAPRWMTRVYRNNHYTVMINDNCLMSDGKTAVKAMIQRHDDAIFPNHWAELQHIKNEVFGHDAVAVEYFPAAKKLTDQHNIYWLFIFPDGRLPIYDQAANHDQL